MFLAAFVCCLATQIDDRAAGTPSHRCLSVSLVVAGPSRMVDWIAASDTFALGGKVEQRAG
jgi:hypothetical protein